MRAFGNWSNTCLANLTRPEMNFRAASETAPDETG
jgi:hypothetical protein